MIWQSCWHSLHLSICLMRHAPFYGNHMTIRKISSPTVGWQAYGVNGYAEHFGTSAQWTTAASSTHLYGIILYQQNHGDYPQSINNARMYLKRSLYSMYKPVSIFKAIGMYIICFSTSFLAPPFKHHSTFLSLSLYTHINTHTYTHDICTWLSLDNKEICFDLEVIIWRPLPFIQTSKGYIGIYHQAEMRYMRLHFADKLVYRNDSINRNYLLVILNYIPCIPKCYMAISRNVSKWFPLSTHMAGWAMYDFIQTMVLVSFAHHCDQKPKCWYWYLPTV